MNTIINNIMLTAETLQVDERVRINCPYCCASENTFSLARLSDGSVVWHCFRASCGKHGRKGQGNLVHTRLRKQKPRKLNPYRGALRRCTEDEGLYLYHKIGWDGAHNDIASPMYAPEINRYAFPIYDPLGLRRGYVLRSYSKAATPKALTHMDRDEPHMSWYRTLPANSTVVVVEDIPSAVRVAKYVNAVALSGTGCSHNYALEIAAHARHVVWALDADALTQCVKLHKKSQLLFEASEVLPIPKDFKDMSEAEIKDILKEYI